jgi:ATP phosphoribosyltransferase
MISVALPKGRLGNQVYRMLAAAGYDCPELLEDSRKLVFENESLGLRYFLVKPSDVATYVARGAADVGVAGKDTLIEDARDVYELLDLGIGRCRMVVAAPEGFEDDRSAVLRVATKYPNTTRAYYKRIGRDIEIIKLHGSIELAPILGLSDVIVDIVETGKTLRENNLAVTGEIIDISARFVANRASYRFKQAEITRMTESLVEVTK